MALLRTDFADDVLSAAMDGKKRVRLTPLDDGTYIIEDVTEYEQIGSSYGQKEINQLNQTVNDKLDAEKVIDSLETAMAVTESGVPAGCLALKELNNNLNSNFIANKLDTTINLKQYVNTGNSYKIPKDGYLTVSCNIGVSNQCYALETRSNIILLIARSNGTLNGTNTIFVKKDMEFAFYALGDGGASFNGLSN